MTRRREQPAREGPPTPARRRDPDPLGSRRQRRGALGEQLAAELLRGKGYRIVAHNLRTAAVEIDLLTRRRRLWVAVEVKTRSTHRAPERTVTPAQHERLVRGLRQLAAVLRPRPAALRVDVVAVRTPPGDRPEIRHFEGREFAP